MVNKITEEEIEAEVARRRGNQKPTEEEGSIVEESSTAAEEELEIWINDLVNNAGDQTVSSKITSVIERLKDLTEPRDNKNQVFTGQINKLLDLLKILKDEARCYEQSSGEETEKLLKQLKNDLDNSKEPRRDDLPGPD